MRKPGQPDFAATPLQTVSPVSLVSPPEFPRAVTLPLPRRPYLPGAFFPRGGVDTTGDAVAAATAAAIVSPTTARVSLIAARRSPPGRLASLQAIAAATEGVPAAVCGGASEPNSDRSEA